MTFPNNLFAKKKYGSPKTYLEQKFLRRRRDIFPFCYHLHRCFARLLILVRELNQLTYDYFQSYQIVF